MLGAELYDKRLTGAIPKPGKDTIVSKNEQLSFRAQVRRRTTSSANSMDISTYTLESEEIVTPTPCRMVSLYNDLSVKVSKRTSIYSNVHPFFEKIAPTY